MDISDIPFSYKRKMGFPRLTDYGVLDIKTLGQGISTQIKMDYFPNDPNKTFVARDVSTFVDNVRFRIHGSQHDRLYRFFRSTMSNVIRGRIAESVEKTVKDWVQRIDAFVTPRKVQYGAPKPSGLSQFESLLGAAGVVSKEAGMQGAAQQGVPSPTDKTKARQEREYKSKLKSRIQTPWESQAFEIRPASAL